MKYFDVHTHTNYSPLDTQAKEISIECAEKNIFYVDIGTNVDTSSIAIKHAQEFPNVYACVGLHPNDIEKIDLAIAMDEIESLLLEYRTKKIVAIGETGLDYHYENFDKDAQEAVFIKHIELAKKYKLPLMVHIRDAHEDAIKILKAHAKGLKVIIHCFTGNSSLVKRYVELDYYISINGVITFNSAIDLREAIKEIPMNRLLSETDAPWLSPAPERGKVNTPLKILYVVDEIAKVLGKNKETIAKCLFQNALDVFNLAV
ncbi:MAG: TatD family hydrolase [Mycoplasmataceae bacterium]|jgi:TatD DNase family protein|nr:TatD family hydrolase [Mycoplasmataceae bacterium]